MIMKKGRVYSIDALRGLAIIGMVLCSAIGFNSGLPAWMFHAQTPPPTYEFNPSIAGLTWVDLVFPFFIFSMGAAFPFAMRRRLDSGMRPWKMMLQLLRRWLTLTAFAIALGNIYSNAGSSAPAWAVSLLNIGFWFSLALCLVQIKADPMDSGLARWRGRIVNLCGLVLIAALFVIRRFCFGLSFDYHSNDIIILILANLALFGGLAWMLSRDNLLLRLLLIVLVIAVKAVDSYAPALLDFVPDCGPVSWLFQWDFLQYLVIALTASIVGDLLLLEQESPDRWDAKRCISAFICLAAVLFQLWALSARQIRIDLLVTLVLALSFILLNLRSWGIYTRIGYIGFLALMLGINLDPLDGGITKDFCNLSYLLTTCGASALMTAFLMMLERHFGLKMKMLCGCGKNPMAAYTITGLLTVPLLSLCKLMPLIYSLAEGSIFWGLMQGFILTAIMIALTCLLSRYKFFLRS